MKIGRLFPDLLAKPGRAASPEVGFARTLERLVTLSGATADRFCFPPARGAPIVVTAGAPRESPLDLWLRERLAGPARGIRLGTPPARPSLGASHTAPGVAGGTARGRWGSPCCSGAAIARGAAPTPSPGGTGLRAELWLPSRALR